MNFIFSKALLLKEISVAQEIINTKNPVSIISNVLLATDENKLIIKATDLKINFETSIPVNVIEHGVATIHCDKFASILNSIPDGDTEFEQNDINITIKPVSKKIKFDLKCLNSENFPEIYTEDKCQYFDVPLKSFRQMITETSFAVSDDETKYFLNGVLLEKKENSLVMVGTDGRRLAYIKKDMETPIPDFKSSIIHPKILNLIVKRTTDEGPISIGINEKSIYFKFGMYKLSSLLIEGQYPNYEKVIPENNEYSFQVDKNDLYEALKRVSLLVEQKSRRIFLEVNPGNLIVQSETKDVGGAKEEIPCYYEGEPNVIAVNSKHLEEPLKFMTEERVKISFSDGMKAMILSPEPASDYFHVMMPMQKD